MNELIVGALYRYSPKNSWCHHGLAVVRRDSYTGALFAEDTYWNGGSDRVPEEQLSTLQFVLDLNKARDVSRDTWETYEEKDRAYIPIGGGPERYFVLIEASPAPRLVREQLEEWIREHEQDIEWKSRRLISLREQLKELDRAPQSAGSSSADPVGANLNPLLRNLRGWRRE